MCELRDFREHEDQLTRWFSQKEKLMDVLGPVAMEPSLLRSQMEQVKVGCADREMSIF